MTGMTVGSIVIDLTLTDDGDEVTSVRVEGDLSVVAQIGLLAMAQDSILNGPEEDDDI